MDYLWIVIPISLVVVILLEIKLINISEINLLSLFSDSKDTEQIQGFEINIPLEILSGTIQFEGRNMFEITDSIIIARISELIPFTSQTGTRMLANNSLNSIKSTELVKIDIPFSQLTKSKEVVGSARGYVHGGKGVAAQANLTKINITKVTKITTVANAVSAVMNVGSLVVGQYYMFEISSKLENITKSMNQIGDFQDREFKSRIISAITLVNEISQFSSEIMENNEQRNLKLVALDNYKSTVTELLGQVNITISDIIQNTQKLDFKEYQFKIDDFQKLLGYQNALITTLEELSKLTYLLGKGSISTERSHFTFNKYLEQSVQLRNLIGLWHDSQSKSLRIDLEKERIIKSGFNAVVSAIPSLFDDKFKYNELNSNLANKIIEQTKSISENSVKVKRIYADDVEIIIKDGRYYYLN